jgi:mRNA-degrading endonuclease RelE of RelBE toxin-antitoxin system
MTQLTLLALSQLVEDEGLKSTLKAFDFPETHDIARGFRDALILGPGESVFDFVPERPTPTITSGFTVRRSVARVGRNAPCPCGSGKKYKKCCYDKDQQRLRHSSDVAGVTVDELRASPEAHLDTERLLAMRSYELSRLDPTKVAAELHPLLLNQLILFGLFESVLAFFQQVGIRDELDGHLVDAINFAADASESAIVRELFELRGDRQNERHQLSLAAQLQVSAEAPGPVLERIEARARRVLETQRSLDSVDFSHSMLSSGFPALGILIARGAVPIASPFDAPVLLDRLLETRDRLELPPEDPIETVYDEQFLDDEWPDEDDTEGLVETRDALEQKSAEVRNLRKEVLELRQRLQRREKRAAAEAMAPTPIGREPEPQADASVTELRQRLASLKGDLTQRHLERNQLRRELVKTREDLNELRAAQTAVPDPRPAAGDDPEDALLASEETFGSQPMRVPTFPNKFAEELEKLPKGVPRAVLRLIGDLAAGEAAAFKGARRLARNREVWRQRVASSFRLLFRLQPRSLEVLALVNRQDLERTIRSLG